MTDESTTSESNESSNKGDSCGCSCGTKHCSPCMIVGALVVVILLAKVLFF